MAEPRPRWRPLLAALIVGAGLVYLAVLAARESEAFLRAVREFRPAELLLAALAALAMQALKALYHLRLCLRLGAPREAKVSLLRAYAVAQVVRYLPGKVWGLVYQAERLSAWLPPSRVLLANALQMLQTNLMASGIILGTLGIVWLGAPWALAATLLLAAVVELLHRWPALERLLLALWARLRRRPLAWTEIPADRWIATAILVLEWLAYYLMWWLLFGPRMPAAEWLLLSTWYAAASLLAILVVVVPGGLAVREALFVALGGMGSGEGAGALVAYAALLRALLWSGEIALVLVLGLGAPARRAEARG
ncbi:MAG: hypothetical protein RML12_03390 [Xanthomonadales bacterium]|nr:hypothetical protein [Xanthomonadales bacterium]